MPYIDYVVQQGDCISSIAYELGMFPGTVWDDPKNSTLKEKRKNPNALLPGDIVHVRQKENKQASLSAETRHRFKRKGVPEKLVVRFMKGDKPRANERFQLDVDGVPSEGATDNDGYVRATINPGARQAIVTFLQTAEKFVFNLGHIDPITEISGVQGRLANLGMYSGPIDGESSQELTEAIRAFQRKNLSESEATGLMDDKTRDKLKQLHGG
jgi:hypothetical protein